VLRAYQRRLVAFCEERLRALGSEAGVVLDLRDPHGLRLARLATDEEWVRRALCERSALDSFAVCYLGVPRAMARTMLAQASDMLDHFDRLGPGFMPVIFISGGCWLAAVPRDGASSSLN
jgi:hypothetical protein